MGEKLPTSNIWYEDVLSKDFFHMNYLRRKALTEEPQRLASVAEAIKRIRPLLEEDEDTFIFLVAAISARGSQGASLFINQFNHAPCIESRNNICKKIFTPEAKGSLNLIHQFSKDYVYDALSLTCEITMDTFIEAIDDYLQAIDQKLHILPGNYLKLGKLNIQSVYPQRFKLFPKRNFDVKIDGNNVYMSANPCCIAFSFDDMMESLLQRIFLLRDTFEDVNSIKMSTIEKKCRTWIQTRADSLWVDSRGLLGRMLGLWIWDYKHKTNATISASIDACHQYYSEVFGQEISTNSLREHFEGTRICITYGEVMPLFRVR